MHAQLVRVHNDISPSPIRALAGAQGGLAASPTARHSVPFPSIGARTVPRNRKYLSIERVTTDPISFGPLEPRCPSAARPLK